MWPIIRKDLLSLSRLPRWAKIALLISGILLVAGAWYPGAEWWLKGVTARYSTRPQPRYGIMVVLLGILILCYIVSVIERYRKSC